MQQFWSSQLNQAFHSGFDIYLIRTPPLWDVESGWRDLCVCSSSAEGRFFLTWYLLRSSHTFVWPSYIHACLHRFGTLFILQPFFYVLVGGGKMALNLANSLLAFRHCMRYSNGAGAGSGFAERGRAFYTRTHTRPGRQGSRQRETGRSQKN